MSSIVFDRIPARLLIFRPRNLSLFRKSKNNSYIRVVLRTLEKLIKVAKFAQRNSWLKTVSILVPTGFWSSQHTIGEKGTPSAARGVAERRGNSASSL